MELGRRYERRILLIPQLLTVAAHSEGEALKAGSRTILESVDWELPIERGPEHALMPNAWVTRGVALHSGRCRSMHLGGLAFEGLTPRKAYLIPRLKKTVVRMIRSYPDSKGPFGTISTPREEMLRELEP